jgi:hypothetical protein
MISMDIIGLNMPSSSDMSAGDHHLDDHRRS